MVVSIPESSNTLSAVGIGALAYLGAYFGQGTDTKQYGNFLCSNESGLLQCPYSTVTCSSNKAAGVRCRGKVAAVTHELYYTIMTYRHY